MVGVVVRRRVDLVEGALGMHASTVDDELQALRRRAYGPNADIQRYPSALERLRELEGAGRPQLRPASDIGLPPEPAPVVEHPAPVDALDDPEEPRQTPAWLATSARLARAGAVRLAHLRRSTVLILLALVVLASILVVTLVVVQRVQTDPLQVGAEQVARLAVDPSFEVPEFFASPGLSDTLQGFDEFHGLQAMVSTGGGLFSRSENDECLSVSSAAVAENSSPNSFSGLLVGGSGAGGFPPIVQFTTDLPDLPDEVRAAFPDTVGLQFVYDSANNEVVVFATR